MELRYLGFDQLGAARAFRFEIPVKGAGARQAVVTAEMGLFLQFHVAIQEGPTLCARKLTADLAMSLDGEHTLTADDLRAYSESKAAAELKRLEMRAASGRRQHKPSTGLEDPRSGL
jgi:hypothetical protein